MTTYKIQVTGENVDYNGSGKFEFPINPSMLNFPLTMDREITETPYGLLHCISTGGGIKPRELVLSGSFKGSTKNSDYNNLSKFVISKDVCRLWLNSDCFYYVFGTGIRPSFSNEKTNFIDYVVTFLTVSPFVYSNSKSVTKTFTHGSEGNTAVLVNSGNGDSMAKITITAGATITSVKIGDGSTFSNSVHSCNWNGSCTSGKSLVLYPFKMFNASGVGDIKSMRFGHPEINGVLSGYNEIKGGSMPLVSAGSTSQTFRVLLTGSAGSSSVKVEWFEASVG